MSLAVRASGGLLVTIAALTAAPDAIAAPTYAGGSLPEAAVTGRAYSPTVGVTLEPLAGGRVAFAFDTTLRCGRATTQVRVARTLRWDGAALTANGVARAPFAGRRVRFAWTAEARADGRRATGSVRIAARRNGTACRGRAPRAFIARLGAAPAGAPSRPGAGAAYYGGGPRLATGRRPGSAVLRVSPDGSRVAARWAVAARCDRGRPQRMTNLTPPTRIGAAGAFDRRERYAVRYADAYVRYRVRFRGRFTGATAGGRLRLRATVRTRRGGRVIARCDTRRRAWTAWADGDPPGTPPPPATPPPPGGTTPPPDPTFRRPATPGPWSFDMTSDPGEYLGQGLTWRHGSAYGEPIRVDVFAAGDIIQFTIQTRDADSWSGSFATLDGTPLRVGTYASPGQGSQSFAGYGRGCGTFTGAFTVEALAYDPDGGLRTVRVTFEAHCEGLPEALRGTFAFQAA